MKKNILNVGIITACCTLALSSSVFALVPTIGGKLSRGVGAICYYVDSSASAYTTYINNGIKKWTRTNYSPSDLIHMTAVSSNKATDVDYYAFYSDSFRDGDCLAETLFFSSTGVEMWGTRPYYYSEIWINKDNYPSMTSTIKTTTMAHELGHAFGLDENNSDPNSIMCQATYRETTEVSAEDYATVVDIYGGV